MNVQEWLSNRRNSIGASDAPSLVGLGFTGAMAVWRSKVEEVAPRVVPDYLRIGLDLEPAIMARYQEVKGVDLTPMGLNILTHPERPWQSCTPDFRRSDGIYVQGKTVGFFDEDWGESGSDVIPDGYRIQVIHEMGVTGTPIIDLAAMSRMTGEFRTYRLTFDPDTWDWLTRIEEEFWGMVQAKTPPPDKWEAQFADAPVLTSRFIVGKTIELPDEYESIIEERERIGAVRKEADEAYKELTNRLKAALGDNESAVAGRYTLSRTITAGREQKAYWVEPQVRLKISKPRSKKC